MIFYFLHCCNVYVVVPGLSAIILCDAELVEYVNGRLAGRAGAVTVHAVTQVDTAALTVATQQVVNQRQTHRRALQPDLKQHLHNNEWMIDRSLHTSVTYWQRHQWHRDERFNMNNH